MGRDLNQREGDHRRGEASAEGRSVRDNRLIPVEQPSDQLGSLLQVLLLDGIHPDIGEVGFNAIKHPRQRHIERKKRMIEIGRVQFGFVALTTFYGCPAPTGNNIAYLIGGV